MLEILKRFGVLDFHCTKNNNNKQLFPSSFSFYIPEGSLQVKTGKGESLGEKYMPDLFVDAHLGGVYVLCVYSHVR